MENEQRLRKLIREWITIILEDQLLNEANVINSDNNEIVILDIKMAKDQLDWKK